MAPDAAVEPEAAGEAPAGGAAVGGAAACEAGAAVDASGAAGIAPTVSVTAGTCANGSTTCVPLLGAAVSPVGSECRSVITFGPEMDGRAVPLFPAGCFGSGGSFGGVWSFGTESVGKPTRGRPTTGSWGTGGETAGYRNAEYPAT